jgi:hypothetical protein
MSIISFNEFRSRTVEQDSHETVLTNKISNNIAWFTGELMKPVLFTPDGRVCAPQGIGSSHGEPPATGEWVYVAKPVEVCVYGYTWTSPGTIEVRINEEKFHLFLDKHDLSSSSDALLEVGSYMKKYYPYPTSTFEEIKNVRSDGVTPAYSFSRNKNKTETWAQTMRRRAEFSAWQDYCRQHDDDMR